ncbi:hypothetical protein D187_001433 [Cystobacter fuscus DSM 2262]|uniref:Lipoprotein n=1 Tax=Cystobacter fuscus (strain ATCC 25194 / DSM 2262 / NBRC 100088 / M29) TaxID=1242864 RepID=S9QHM6_CYSF2|nr:hypothetical protein [Cystobacter fuscus]EPX60784.1 hypothetical protein D187_001433 [Cystobacter fuscus DSM 2262]
MRIKSILAVFISGLALSLTACGTEAVQIPESEPATVQEQAAQQSTDLVGICPLKWTCNYQNYYTTQTQCAAACGSDTCTRDYACTGTCVCP